MKFKHTVFSQSPCAKSTNTVKEWREPHFYGNAIFYWYSRAQQHLKTQRLREIQEMNNSTTGLSMDQITAMRAQVLGAVAKAPGMLIALGILFIALGMIGVAGQVMFSFVTINILGAFLIIGGVLQGIHAFQSSGWKSVGIQIVFAILYIVAGLYTWLFPIPALEVITLWLAAIFFITGFLRLIAAFHHRPFGQWFWLVLSAIISILMGLLIMNSYPASSFWLPGLLIAIELLLQGWTLLFIGIAAKSHTAS